MALSLVGDGWIEFDPLGDEILDMPQLPLYNFYPRDAMLARVFATATCPSVRPSHAGRIVKCTPSYGPMTLLSGKV